MHDLMINIISNITDYIICKECSRENWYENDSCISCGLERDGEVESAENLPRNSHRTNFRAATEKDAERLRKYCRETEGMDLESEVDI